MCFLLSFFKRLALGKLQNPNYFLNFELMFKLVWLIPAELLALDYNQSRFKKPKENKCLPFRSQNIEVITGDGVIPT
jgi:hypothetical protein